MLAATETMTLDSEKHHRRSIRLKGYDYSYPGTYFVTICVHDRRCIFGDIIDRQMIANPAGNMVTNAWNELPKKYEHVATDFFVLMPNHIHGIIVLNPRHVGAAPCGRPVCSGAQSPQGQPQGVAPTRETLLTLCDVVHRFKSWTTKLYSDGVKKQDWPSFPGRLWQRNYYEHVIRDDEDLNKIREYIVTNPYSWVEDKENPQKGTTRKNGAAAVTR
jgi:putative transposase